MNHVIIILTASFLPFCMASIKAERNHSDSEDLKLSDVHSKRLFKDNSGLGAHQVNLGDKFKKWSFQRVHLSKLLYDIRSITPYPIQCFVDSTVIVDAEFSNKEWYSVLQTIAVKHDLSIHYDQTNNTLIVQNKSAAKIPKVALADPVLHKESK